MGAGGTSACPSMRPSVRRPWLAVQAAQVHDHQCATMPAWRQRPAGCLSFREASPPAPPGTVALRFGTRSRARAAARWPAEGVRCVGAWLRASHEASWNSSWPRAGFMLANVGHLQSIRPPRLHQHDQRQRTRPGGHGSSGSSDNMAAAATWQQQQHGSSGNMAAAATWQQRQRGSSSAACPAAAYLAQVGVGLPPPARLQVRKLALEVVHCGGKGGGATNGSRRSAKSGHRAAGARPAIQAGSCSCSCACWWPCAAPEPASPGTLPTC